MSEINLKLKSYDELIFEITTLNTNKYLLEQKLNKQKEVLDKIKEYCNNRLDYYNEMRRDYMKEFDGYAENDMEEILYKLEEIE